jgi:acetolactate synthase-1/2/3 large subunit
MYEPVTKWNATVPSIHRIDDMISSAVRNSIIGCTGPTHVSIPRDYLNSDEKIEEDKTLFNDCVNIYPHTETEDINKIIEKITQSKRPIILAGAGVLISKAENELKEFAQIFKIPVATSTGGKGSFIENDSLSIGVVGQHSRKVANKIMGEADLVIVLGSDLGGMVTNDRKLFSANVKIIQIDIDVAKIGSTRKVDFPIQSDIRSALQAIILKTKLKKYPKNSISQGWLTNINKQVQAWYKDLHNLETRSKTSGTIYHETIMKILRQKANPKDILVSDTGYSEAWTAAIYPVLKAGRFYLRPAGTLGWAFPAAMGAQLAKPNNRVVCVTGDGGLAYHIGNLETAVRLQIPTITIVLNNQSFAFEHHYQKYLFGKVIPEVNDFAKVDHAAVARAHGAFGVRVNSDKELSEALDEAYLQKGPSIIDVPVDKEALAPVAHYGNKINQPI